MSECPCLSYSGSSRTPLSRLLGWVIQPCDGECGLWLLSHRKYALILGPRTITTHTPIVLLGRDPWISPGISGHPFVQHTHTHGFDNKALLPLHTALWAAISTDNLRPARLTQTKYRASIRHLIRCMQARGAPMVLRPILSHMEHTSTKDPELNIPAQRSLGGSRSHCLSGGGGPHTSTLGHTSATL